MGISTGGVAGVFGDTGFECDSSGTQRRTQVAAGVICHPLAATANGQMKFDERMIARANGAPCLTDTGGIPSVRNTQGYSVLPRFTSPMISIIPQTPYDPGKNAPI